MSPFIHYQHRIPSAIVIIKFHAYEQTSTTYFIMVPAADNEQDGSIGESLERTEQDQSSSGSAEGSQLAHRTSGNYDFALATHRTSGPHTAVETQVRCAAEARQWLDEDVVLQAFAYAACDDHDFRDRVPYKLFHSCCYTLAMVTDDHQHISSTAAEDCLRVWKENPFIRPDGFRIELFDPIEGAWERTFHTVPPPWKADPLELPEWVFKHFHFIGKKLMQGGWPHIVRCTQAEWPINPHFGPGEYPNNHPEHTAPAAIWDTRISSRHIPLEGNWNTAPAASQYTACAALRGVNPAATVEWEWRRRRIAAHTKVWEIAKTVEMIPQVDEFFRRRADNYAIIPVQAASPAATASAPLPESTAPAAVPESTAPAAVPEFADLKQALPPPEGVHWLAATRPGNTKRTRQERTCGMCSEVIVNYAGNGKLHENCRSLRDTMGEAKAKEYLHKRKAEFVFAELAEANGAPANKQGKHAAPAAHTAPADIIDPWVRTRDIRNIPNAD